MYSFEVGDGNLGSVLKMNPFGTGIADYYAARVEKFLLDLKLDLTWSLQAEQSKDCLNISIFNSALLCSAWLETFKSAWKCEAEAARKFEPTWIFYSSNSSKTAQAEHFAWNFYNE